MEVNHLSEIWIVNQYAITPDLPGGTRHYDIARELVKKGYTVKIFASDFNLALRKHSKLEHEQEWSREVIDQVEFIWLRTKEYKTSNFLRFLNMWSFGRAVARVGREIASQPDVIIGSSPHLFGAFRARLLARKRGARFVLELRDLWPQALIDLGVSSLNPVIVLFRILEKYLYKNAELIIVLAKGSVNYLETYGVDRSKIIYIPNGVYLEQFNSSMTKEEARLRYSFNKFTFIYTGAHGFANSLDTIIEAAAILREDKDVEFILVGDGPEKSRLKDRVHDLRLGNIRFLDPVPKTEIPDLLKAADIALITLRKADAFNYGISPNKLFDYMAMEKPVIAALTGDMADIVSDTGCGLVCLPENSKALAAAVKCIMEKDETVLLEMGAKGRRLIEAEYSRSSLAEALIGNIFGKFQQQL